LRAEGIAMQLYSVSINEIETDLINYFRANFPADTAPIFPGSDVKKRYRYTPEAWAELADELSQLPWMVRLGVVLIQDDMRGVTTIAQLAGLISKHIRQVVAPKAHAEVTPLSTLMRSAQMVRPAGKGAAVKKAAKRPAKKKKAKKNARK
jgi:hypothetical protein